MLRRIIVFFALLTVSAALAPAQAQESAACEGRAAMPAGASSHTLESGGLTRVYNLYVPSGYDPAAHTPLVLSLHGAVSSADEQQEKTGWDAVAEREGFVVAYPQGYLRLAIGFRWKAGEPMRMADSRIADAIAAADAQVDDVAFIDDLLTHLSDTLCIDPARIYVNGFSNGGGMTHHLACKLAGRIAAIGTNAGAYTPIPGGCEPSRPVPVVTFQGVQDPIVPIEGDEQMGLQGVESWAADWAARNGCGDTPVAVDYPADTVSAVEYTGCTDDASVVVYILSDGGHTWPGGTWGLPFILGRTNTDIDASETMWDFFAAHPMP